MLCEIFERPVNDTSITSTPFSAAISVSIPSPIFAVNFNAAAFAFAASFTGMTIRNVGSNGLIVFVTASKSPVPAKIAASAERCASAEPHLRDLNRTRRIDAEVRE